MRLGITEIITKHELEYTSKFDLKNYMKSKMMQRLADHLTEHESQFIQEIPDELTGHLRLRYEAELLSDGELKAIKDECLAKAKRAARPIITDDFGDEVQL